GRAVEQTALARREADAHEVEHPPYNSRIATGLHCGGVDARIGVGNASETTLDVLDRRQPPVTHRARELEHPRLVCAHPDPDVVGRTRAALGALRGVVRALDSHDLGVVDVPQLADDLDRLLERGD